MNEIHAKAMRAGNVYFGLLRKVHKSDYEPVCLDGKPIAFRTAEEAEVAAWRALKPHINSIMRRDGETLPTARLAAEKLFRTREAHGQREDGFQRKAGGSEADGGEPPLLSRP